MRRLGVPATARASFSVYNTRDEVDRLVDALEKRQVGLRSLSRWTPLYREYILDHYKNPRNFGELEQRDAEFYDRNPLCGDEMGVHIKLEGDRDRRPALPRPGLRDLAGDRLDHLRRAEGQDRRRGRRRSTATSSPRRSASSSPPPGSSAACWR